MLAERISSAAKIFAKVLRLTRPGASSVMGEGTSSSRREYKLGPRETLALEEMEPLLAPDLRPLVGVR